MELDKWWSVAAPGELGRGSDFADACEAGEDIRDYKRSEGRSIEVKDTPSAITRNVGPQRTEQGAASSRCDDGTGSKRCDTLGQLAVVGAGEPSFCLLFNITRGCDFCLKRLGIIRGGVEFCRTTMHLGFWDPVLILKDRNL